MPLDDMLKVLEEDGEKQREAVKEEANREVKEIDQAAREEGENIRDEQIDMVLAPLAREKAKILNDAKMEVKKKLAQTKRDLLLKVNSGARQKIETLRNTPEWEKIFRRLLSEASQRIQGKIVVKVDQRDKDIAQKTLKELGLQCELQVNSGHLGGATVTSEDGRVSLINTFESRLERAGRDMRPVITSTLFGDGDGSRL